MLENKNNSLYYMVKKYIIQRNNNKQKQNINIKIHVGDKGKKKNKKYKSKIENQQKKKELVHLIMLSRIILFIFKVVILTILTIKI